MICAFTFGLFSLLTATITNIEQLVVYRFIAGVGLGGTIPNALAFGSEYAPSRLRKTFVVSMWAGIPSGLLSAGLVAAWFIPQFGWTSIFIWAASHPS